VSSAAGGSCRRCGFGVINLAGAEPAAPFILTGTSGSATSKHPERHFRLGDLEAFESLCEVRAASRGQ
jgi:hypothetical protein